MDAERVVRQKWRRRYPMGKKISAKECRALKVERDAFHGNWNYVIKLREMQRS